MRDAEDLVQEVERMLSNYSQAEKEQWKSSGLTNALMLYLQACIVSLHEQWETGSFTTESVDGSMQKNAEAIGSVSTLHDVKEFISDINKEEYN